MNDRTKIDWVSEDHFDNVLGSDIIGHCDQFDSLGKCLLKLHIVIPIAPGDLSWRGLLKSEQLQGMNSSIILSVSDEAGASEKRLYERMSSQGYLVVTGPKGRGRQLNLATKQIRGGYLWFLHSDSQLPENAIELVQNIIRERKDGLHFFDLKFVDEGEQRMAINEAGVLFRSRLLKIPFGDQGFLIKTKTFKALGSYSESTSYGEDHLLVWACHQAGVPVKPIGASIRTSARKYVSKGWLRTTLQHLYLTGRQASPELATYLRKKWKVCN